MEQLLIEHQKPLSREERNKEIVRLRYDEGYDRKELAKIFELTEQQIGNILRANHRFHKIDADYIRKESIVKAGNEYDKAPETKRDKLEWLQELNKLANGDKKDFSNITINKVEVLIINEQTIPDQNERQDSQGDIIDIETSQMSRKQS